MKKFILTILCCLLMCGSAEAKVTIEQGAVTATSETLLYSPDYSYSTGGASKTGFVDMYVSNYVRTTGLKSCSVCGASCSNYPPYRISASLPSDYCKLIGSSYVKNGPTYLFINNYAFTAGKFGVAHTKAQTYTGSSGYYANGSAQRVDVTASWNAGNSSGTHRGGCSNTTPLAISWLSGAKTETVDAYHISGVSYHGGGTHTYRYTDTSSFSNLSELILKGCKLTDTTFSDIGCSVTISNGIYSGPPALNSLNITVNSATVKDSRGQSIFSLGPDSEQTVSQGADGTTITTVKLSNPPVIIDWADFPG